MTRPIIYKIHDTDLDEYSQYIAVSRECKKIIENAVDDYYQEDTMADNVFEAIEIYLDEHDIEYCWIKFEDDNTIDF